jgi:regulatory protein
VAADPLSLAAKALRRRERSRSELADWLAKRGVPQTDVEVTLAQLEQLGELDDARFARLYAEDKRELGGWGAERIRDALRSRGIAEPDIEAALNGSQEDELARAISLISRRPERLDTEEARGRALAFLTRRGYPYELAYEAVRTSEREAV